MDLTHRFLGECSVVPDRLDDLFGYLGREVAARRRSTLSHVQRREALLGGVAVPLVALGAAEQFWPDFPVVGDLKLSRTGVKMYLARLLAPDDLHELRRIVADAMSIDDLDRIAGDLITLHRTDHRTATALLELRLRRACRFHADHLRDLGRSRAFEQATLFDDLLVEFSRIRIGYCLHRIALDCGRQIHAPLGLEALDGLDRVKSAGTLRQGTLQKRLEHDLTMFDRVSETYHQGRRRPVDISIGESKLDGADNTSVIFTGLSCPATDREVAELRMPDDLIGQARVQLGIWRRKHGDLLEDIVEQQLTAGQGAVGRLRRGLQARKEKRGHNAVVGNLDRVAAGVRLHWAVEEAIAWTADPPGADEDRSGSYVVKRAEWLRQQRAGIRLAPPKWKHLHASKVAPLFMALRFAFLQDDEELPLALRNVLDATTGEVARVKSHARASLVSGRHYTFAQKWAALIEVRAQKLRELPPGASPGKMAQARQFQYDMKREAHKQRKACPSLSGGAFARTLAFFRQSVLVGFVEP